MSFAVHQPTGGDRLADILERVLDKGIVVAGDVTQIDLPSNQQSGLVDAVWRLRGIAGFAQVELTEADIVRHRLVQDIVRAYEDKPTAQPSKGRRR